MGKSTFTQNGTFNTIPGITTYNFVVVGGGGGGAGFNFGAGTPPPSNYKGGNGGNGATVTTTYTNVIASSLQIFINGGGNGGDYTGGSPNVGGNGGGLTQVLNLTGTGVDVNIVAGAGGGAGGDDTFVQSDCNGANGGFYGPTNGAGGNGGGGGSGGNADGTGGTGSFFGKGGNYNNNGAGGNGSLNIGGGGGGGGAGSNGIAGTGAGFAANGNGGGGASGAGVGGGGGGGFGGGGFGTIGGGAGSSIALNADSVVYSTSPYNSLPYGVGGTGYTTVLISSNGQPGQSGYVEITWDNSPPQPISNICFPAGTPIKTDQGLVNIDQIQTDKHTINGKVILGITKTVTLDKYLICFQPSSIGRNIPNKKTVMTKDHLIEYKGQFIPAYRFLNFSKDVKKVQYLGETLYNVLLAEHSIMDVNNLKCETLHPDNIIAKLYMSNFSDSEKNDVIYHMNNALQKRDITTYKNIVNQLHTF